MKRKLLALGLTGIGVVGLSYAARGQRLSPVGIVVAMAAFFGAASVMSKVAALASKVQPFVGKTVTVRTWGDAPADGELFTVVSVRAISAGLHIYLRPQLDGRPVHLKIAQPRQAQVTDSAIAIADAKYIQWAGKKIERSGGATTLPAFVMQIKK